MTVREVTIQETAAALAWNVKAMVNYGDIITQKHIEKHGGVWSVNDQIAHVHSEVSEVFQAWRKEGPDALIQECMDVLLSGITLLTIIRLNVGWDKVLLNQMIDEQCLAVTKKLYQRVGIRIK